MKKFLAVAAFAFAIQSSFADTLALWTFETTSNSLTGASASLGPILADSGSGSASGVHASAATVWSHPAGNGSGSSFSANTWAQGDYFQFQVSTLGFLDITASYDQTRSSTGPATFTFSYSTDGINFTPFLTDYTVLNNAASAGPPVTAAWSATSARQSAYTFTQDLSALSAVENIPALYFRVIDDSATGAVGGTGRIDNFLVSATAVPEPSILGLLGLGACALALRRSRG